MMNYNGKYFADTDEGKVDSETFILFPQITPFNLKGTFPSDKQKYRVFYFVMHLVNGRILPDPIIINLDLEVLGQPHAAYSVKTRIWRIECLNLGNNNE